MNQFPEPPGFERMHIGEAPGPIHTEDIAAPWRDGIAYRLTVDLARCYLDPEGRLHLHGEITNTGSRPISFRSRADGSLRIGARLVLLTGETPVDCQARALPPVEILPPGAAARFGMRLPMFEFDESCRGIEVSLVCEDRFWFGDVGFPKIMVAPSDDIADSTKPQELPVSEVEALKVVEANEPLSDGIISIEPVIVEPGPGALRDYQQSRLGVGSQATLDDLWNCYRLLLNRDADPGGFELFAQGVREGMTIEALVGHFVMSEEFAYRQITPRRAEPIRTRINGIDLYVGAPQTPADRHMLATGQHKPHLAGAISSVLAPDQFVLDIGAGFGDFTALAARRVGPKGRVVSLEPSPSLLRLLLANITALGFGNVDALPFCAADGDGFVTLVRRGAILTARDVTSVDLTTGADVAVVYARTIDSIVPIDQRVDVLKLALDGFDYRAMLGAKETVCAWRPQFFGEYAPGLLNEFSGIEPIRYLELLRECGYDRFSAMTREHGAIELGDDIGKLAGMPSRLGVAAVDFYAEPK